MVSGILFDMDGLLVDSEPLLYETVAKALEKQGILISEDKYYAHWTRAGKNIEHLRQELNIPIDREKYRKDKLQIYPQLVREKLRIMRGAEEKVKEMSGLYKTAIVSSSTRENIKAVLEKTGFGRYFSAIVTGDDVTRWKPEPDSFLLGAQKLDVKPEECVVIEDALKGVVAAKRAGMKAIAIPNEYTKQDDFSQADAVLSDLTKLTPELIEMIVRRGKRIS